MKRIFLILFILLSLGLYGCNNKASDDFSKREAVPNNVQIKTEKEEEKTKETKAFEEQKKEPKKESEKETLKSEEKANDKKIAQEEAKPTNDEITVAFDDKKEEVSKEAEKKNIVTLFVSCETILKNTDKLDSDKKDLLGSNGIIYEKREVEFNEGESVFDVTLRELKKNKIHFEYSVTPLYNSVYVEGINNIYEFDCGAMSGWKYFVNGVFPKFGCSEYILKNGDEISWIYTVDGI